MAAAARDQADNWLFETGNSDIIMKNHAPGGLYGNYRKRLDFELPLQESWKKTSLHECKSDLFKCTIIWKVVA